MVRSKKTEETCVDCGRVLPVQIFDQAGDTFLICGRCVTLNRQSGSRSEKERDKKLWAVEVDRKETQRRLNQALDVLRDMVIQHCGGPGGYADSKYISANADAMDILVQNGFAEYVDRPSGRSVYVLVHPEQADEL